jgi:ribonuclease III
VLKPRKIEPPHLRDFSKVIRNIFGFIPGNIFLYSLAFRHKSAAEERRDGVRISNERLEFLGDAILDAVVADFLFKRFPFKDEGFLTEMRARIVSRQNLNKLALKLGIDKLVVAGEEHISPNSSVFGDAFEALLGAIYIDKGYDFTHNLIIENIIGLHMDLDLLEHTDSNYKSRLIQLSQKEKFDIEFKVIGETGSGSSHHYIVSVFIDGKPVASGQDHSIKMAEQNAAEHYFQQLEHKGSQV